MATPTTNFFTPGPTNVFIPEATDRMVEFSRNPETFAFAEYAQIVPVDKIVGLFAELSTLDPINVVNLHETLWPDGQERPVGRTRPLRWVQYTAERHAYDFTLGGLAVEQAAFPIVTSHARAEAVRAMTSRTLDANGIVATSGNWPTNNTAATIDALLSTSSASWTSSSVTENFIKRSFNTVKRTIGQQTGGAVRPADLSCVVNPTLASQMGETAEILAYVVNHEQSLISLQGRDARLFDDYGLPPFLYGIRMIVEDAVRKSDRRAAGNEFANSTVGYIHGDTDAFFLARPGGQVANAGENTLATLVAFIHEDMIVESERDPWNRLTRGSVVDTRDIVLAAGNSGFGIFDATS